MGTKDGCWLQLLPSFRVNLLLYNVWPAAGKYQELTWTGHFLAFEFLSDSKTNKTFHLRIWHQGLRGFQSSSYSCVIIVCTDMRGKNHYRKPFSAADSCLYSLIDSSLTLLEQYNCILSAISSFMDQMALWDVGNIAWGDRVTKNDLLLSSSALLSISASLSFSLKFYRRQLYFI